MWKALRVVKLNSIKQDLRIRELYIKALHTVRYLITGLVSCSQIFDYFRFLKFNTFSPSGTLSLPLSCVRSRNCLRLSSGPFDLPFRLNEPRTGVDSHHFLFSSFLGAVFIWVTHTHVRTHTHTHTRISFDARRTYLKFSFDEFAYVLLAACSSHSNFFTSSPSLRSIHKSQRQYIKGYRNINLPSASAHCPQNPFSPTRAYPTRSIKYFWVCFKIFAAK